MATVVISGGNVVSVGPFFAALYWGFVLSTSFVGISLVQGYVYFIKGEKVRWPIKALVISLLVLDPTTSFLMAGAIYHYFVKHFGDVGSLEKIPLAWAIENELTVLVTAMVQVFFATRVYFVHDAVNTLHLGPTAPVLVFIFAIVAFAMGTVRTVLIGIWSAPDFSRILFQAVMMIEESCALASDLLTSASLCYLLAPPRLGSIKRSEAVKMMFMFSINRAVLVSVIQIGLLSSYLAAKYYLYWVPFHLCKSKLYTNTLLAMLNSRSGGNRQSHAPSRRQLSAPVINLTPEGSQGTVRLSTDTLEDVEKLPYRPHRMIDLGANISDPSS